MPKRKSVRINPPPTQTDSNMTYVWKTWFNQIFDRVGEGPFKIAGYSRTALPSASEWASTSSSNPFSSLIWVYDASGGIPGLAYSNGSDWLLVHNNAAV